MGSLLKIETKPLILSLLFKYQVGGLKLSGKFNIVEYGIAIWSFLKMLFILYVVPIYIPCTFIGREVEQRSINMLLSKEKRSKILIAKTIVSVAAIILFTLAFFIISFISFKLFLTGTKFAVVGGAILTKSNFMLIAMQLLEMIFVTLLSVILNTIIKGNAALVIGFGAVALERALQNISAIEKYVPTFMSDFNNMSELSMKALNTFFTKSIIIYAIYAVVLLVSSLMIWKKREF